MEKVLNGGARDGFQTPSLAFGADSVMEIEGVTREDERDMSALGVGVSHRVPRNSGE